MKRTLILSTAICALLASAIYAFGDIARPKVSPSPEEGKIVFHTSLLVTSDSKAYEARLQISQETLKRIREATADASVNESLTQRIVHSSTRTMMAGVFMFLAVSFAGIWVARSSQRRGTRQARNGGPRTHTRSRRRPSTPARHSPRSATSTSRWAGRPSRCALESMRTSPSASCSRSSRTHADTVSGRSA